MLMIWETGRLLWRYRKQAVRFPSIWGDKVCTADWLCRDEEAGAVTEDTENILVLITGMKGNRRKVAAARNELARRMKSAF